MTMKTATKFLYVLVPFVASFIFGYACAQNLFGMQVWFVFWSILCSVVTISALISVNGD